MEPTQISESFPAQELLDCLKASELLSAEDFERATQAASDPKASGFSLAQSLVSSGILTPYQAEAASKHRPAELRIGNYDVLDRLGAGGMGTVFKARHRRMKRIVALKVLAQLGRGRVVRPAFPARSGDHRLFCSSEHRDGL